MNRQYKNAVVVAGASGGGKGGGASGTGATEAPTSLRSKQIAHIIDLLGEGEWEGLIDGPAGIFLNDVPLFTPTTPTNDVVDLDETTSKDGVWTVPGTWNFKGISLEFRYGIQAQAAIRAADSASAINVVNVVVPYGFPVVSTITNPNVDTAIVNIAVNQLYSQDTTNGNISGHFVDIEIQTRPGAGGWTSVKKDRIQGKTMSTYVRTYSIDLHLINPTPNWDIRVIRISPDDPDSSKHSEITFASVNLVSRTKYRYPNSVLCSLGIDSSQLSTIPTRSYLCKMARIRVPANYNPTTRVYTGVWDGTFQTAWSDNPAWCLYDMITHPRYGLGDYVDETLTDKWALYAIGQYCDGLVPDGFGGTEPRFRLNAYFQTAEEAINLIQNMASTFRGILYYLNESLTALQDSPRDSVYQFNPTNVVDGMFSYAGASGSTRHTVVMVVWNNPEIGYKQDIEVVEDPAGLLRFGYRPVTVQALGCTSRGQAHRIGLWTLYVEQYEADLISFSTALEGTGVQPGDIIDVFDPTRANIRLGGRVLGQVGQVMQMDKAVILPAGTHSVSFISDTGELVTRTATTAAGTFTSITFNGTGAVPSIASIFGIQTATVLAQQFRIISIVESDKNKYDITGVAYNVAKYAYIEYGMSLTTRPIRADLTPPPAPQSIGFTESLYLLADGSIANQLIVSWEQISNASYYVFSYQVGSGNWSPEQRVDSHTFTIEKAVEGWTYSVRITGFTVNDIRGAQGEDDYIVLGAKFPPPMFDTLACTVGDSGIRFISYGYSPGNQPLDYLGAQIRYYLGTTSDWDVMSPLGDGFFTASPVETSQMPIGTYTIAAKAEDKTHSLSAAKFITSAFTVDPGTITKDLTPPPTPTGFAVTAGLSQIMLEHDNPTYTMGRGHLKTRVYGKVWVSGALPVFADATLVHEFTGDVSNFPSPLGTKWYLWIKWVTKDEIESVVAAGGTNGLLASTGLVGGADLTDQLITADKLADGALSLESKFSSTIRPIEILATLPVTGNSEGRLVYLTTNDKLYRYNGSAFTSSADGADLIANSVTANELAAGSITAVKLAVNAIAVGTAAIENGAIVNAAIGNLAVDNANIANLAVTNGKIADLNVNTIKINGYAVTVPLVGVSSSVLTGTGSVQNVLQLFPFVPYAADMLITFSAVQGFYAGPAAWGITIFVDGVVQFATGLLGANIQTLIAATAGVYMSAGSHTVTVQWNGHSSMEIGQRVLTCTAAMK